MIGMDGGAAGGNANMLRLKTDDPAAIALVNLDRGMVNDPVDAAITWALAEVRPVPVSTES